MKEQKGITLIALVITIIVLLILAGISIATLTGENGILTKANTAKKITIEGEEKEQISLAYNGAKTEKLQISNISNVIAKDLQLQLDAQNTKATAVDKGNKIKVTFSETRNQYIIDGSKGEIEKAKEEIPITFKVLNTDFTTNLRGYVGRFF